MISRLACLVGALVLGIVVASLLPNLSERVRGAIGMSAGPAKSAAPPDAERKQQTEETDNQPNSVKLSEADIQTAGIELTEAQSGTIARRIVAPGSIVPHADRIAKVAVRLSGTVAELRKKIGDPVEKGEVLAILDSREVADAKSEFLAARLTNELQQDLFERDKVLWDKKVATEQQYLRSRNQAAQAKMRADITRQKLFALGLMASEIADLISVPEASLGRQEVRSPMTGRVVERKVELGAAVGRDNLETEIFTIADLGRVWVEVAVSPADLPFIREGQTVSVSARGIAEEADGKIVFISPMLDKETRSAHVVAEIDNSDGVWRPGSFVTAGIAIEEHPVSIAVPAGALQTMGGGQVVFVQTAGGFEKRPVTVGQSDDRVVEITSGLRAGETIAVKNSFLLKAELMKALAED